MAFSVAVETIDTRLRKRITTPAWLHKDPP
jgi:hypothetical protein